MIPLSVPEILPCDGFVTDEERRGRGRGIGYSSSWMEVVGVVVYSHVDSSPLILRGGVGVSQGPGEEDTDCQ